MTFAYKEGTVMHEGYPPGTELTLHTAGKKFFIVSEIDGVTINGKYYPSEADPIHVSSNRTIYPLAQNQPAPQE